MSIRQIISVELQAVDHKNMQVVQNFIRVSNIRSNKPLNTCQKFVVTIIGICEIADVDTLILLIHFWNFKDRITYLF